MDFSVVLAVFTAFLTAAGPLAVGVTKAVDLVRNLIDAEDSLPPVLWNVLAFAFGVALCVGWQFNLAGSLAHSIPALAGSARLDGVAGQALTGIAVGGMAGFWHSKLKAWSTT